MVEPSAGRIESACRASPNWRLSSQPANDRTSSRIAGASAEQAGGNGALPASWIRFSCAVAAGVDCVQVRERDLDARDLAALVADMVARREDPERASSSTIAWTSRWRQAPTVSICPRTRSPCCGAGLVPKGFLIGCSVHSLREAAARPAADYLIAGTVSPSRRSQAITRCSASRGSLDRTRRPSASPRDRRVSLERESRRRRRTSRRCRGHRPVCLGPEGTTCRAKRRRDDGRLETIDRHTVWFDTLQIAPPNIGRNHPVSCLSERKGGDFGSRPRRLRERRVERKGCVALREIANATKISKSARRSTRSRRTTSHLPGGIFSRAFVRRMRPKRAWIRRRPSKISSGSFRTNRSRRAPPSTRIDDGYTTGERSPDAVSRPPPGRRQPALAVLVRVFPVSSVVARRPWTQSRRRRRREPSAGRPGCVSLAPIRPDHSQRRAGGERPCAISATIDSQPPISSTPGSRPSDVRDRHDLLLKVSDPARCRGPSTAARTWVRSGAGGHDRPPDLDNYKDYPERPVRAPTPLLDFFQARRGRRDVRLLRLRARWRRAPSSRSRSSSSSSTIRTRKCDRPRGRPWTGFRSRR